MPGHFGVVGDRFGQCVAFVQPSVFVQFPGRLIADLSLFRIIHDGNGFVASLSKGGTIAVELIPNSMQVLPLVRSDRVATPVTAREKMLGNQSTRVQRLMNVAYIVEYPTEQDCLLGVG